MLSASLQVQGHVDVNGEHVIGVNFQETDSMGLKVIMTFFKRFFFLQLWLPQKRIETRNKCIALLQTLL